MSAHPGTARACVAGLAMVGVGALFLEAVGAAGLVLCALGVGWAAARAPALRVPLRAVALPAAPFLAWALLAPLLAGRPPTGTGVARLADLLLVPVVALAWTQAGPAARRRLGYGLGALLLASCALAAVQSYGLWPREAAEALAWTRLPFARMEEPVPGLEGRFMAGGLHFHRLKFAHVGGFAVLAALALALRTHGRTRAAALALALVGAGAVVAFAFARAASVALLAAGALVVVLALPRRVGLAAAGALLLTGVLALAVHRPLRERFLTSGSTEGSGARVALLDAGQRALRAHPVAGLAPGRFRVGAWAAPDAPPYVKEHRGKSHNQLLSLAVETGVPGALLFLAALAAWARRLRPAATWEGLAAVGALAFFLLVGLTHDPLFHPQMAWAFYALLGLGLSPAPPAPGGTPPASAAHSPPT